MNSFDLDRRVTQRINGSSVLRTKTVWQLAFLLTLVSVRGVASGQEATLSPSLPETTPWTAELLNRIPACEWIERKAAVRSLTYRGELYQGKATSVFAYYATPGSVSGKEAEDRDLPAIVLVHGGGGTAFQEWVRLWAKRGYAAIAMDLAGSRPVEDGARGRGNRIRLVDGGPDQGDDEKFGSVDETPSDQWPYHAVANVILAHSLIRSFPEVDKSRTAVSGISWGGYLTCIVAGVDNRFKAAVPVYGCGYLHENSAWLSRFEKMQPRQRTRWVSLWDPSQYLPSVSMPIFFVNGTNDFAYPLDSYFKSIDLVPGEKNVRITVSMPHGHRAGWAPPEIGVFVDHHLRGMQSLTRVDVADPTADALVFACRGEVKARKASLHFTIQSGAINKRKWTTEMADLKENRGVARVPSSATAWFLSVEDVRGAIVSSRVFFRERE